MRSALIQVLVLLILSISPTATQAENMMIENFELKPETRWRFFTDTVMGGVSSGEVAFLEEDGRTFARMTGRVSTANNGGFIQMRTDLPNGAPIKAEGVRLIVRGTTRSISSIFAPAILCCPGNTFKQVSR